MIYGFRWNLVGNNNHNVCLEIKAGRIRIMAQLDLKGVFMKMSLIGILTLSIMSWIIITQTNNNVEYLITNNSLINESYFNLSSQLQSTQGQSETATSNFGNVTPTATFGELDVDSVISPTRIFKTLTLGTYNILVKLPQQVLGIPEPISAVISSIILLLLILGAWAVWKGVINV